MIGELLTSGVIGAIGGWVMSYKAAQQQYEAERDARQLDAILALAKASTESHDAAEKRGLDGGKVNRRIILLALLVSAVLAPVFMPFFGVPLIVRDEWTSPEWLFGLIPQMQHFSYMHLDGYFVQRVILDGVAALVGFHFGSATARGKG